MKKHNIIKNLHKSHKTPPTIRLIYISDFQYRKCKILQLEYISYFLYFPTNHPYNYILPTGSGMFSNKVISLQRDGKALKITSPQSSICNYMLLLLTVEYHNRNKFLNNSIANYGKFGLRFCLLAHYYELSTWEKKLKATCECYWKCHFLWDSIRKICNKAIAMKFWVWLMVLMS